mmetsp:Transcript_34926/g.83716  ORF Transcript_34926/g.83716 Transcript_34926/m.83716 type:complete len:236 (+) Transcript_34926:893-1600(+)
MLVASTRWHMLSGPPKLFANETKFSQGSNSGSKFTGSASGAAGSWPSRLSRSGTSLSSGAGTSLLGFRSLAAPRNSTPRSSRSKLSALWKRCINLMIPSSPVPLAICSSSWSMCWIGAACSIVAGPGKMQTRASLAPPTLDPVSMAPTVEETASVTVSSSTSRSGFARRVKFKHETTLIRSVFPTISTNVSKEPRRRESCVSQLPTLTRLGCRSRPRPQLFTCSMILRKDLAGIG